MIFYTGAALKRSRGDSFSGSRATRHLNRLVVEDGHVIHEERLLLNRHWKVRAVQQAPNGCIYIGIDGGLPADRIALRIMNIARSSESSALPPRSSKAYFAPRLTA